MDSIRNNDDLPSLEIRRRLMLLQRIFFTLAIALSIIFGGGVLRAALYHVLDNRAFEKEIGAATLAGEPRPQLAGLAPLASRTGPIAKLEIPRIGLSVIVLDGTDEWTLNRGVGHIAGTSYPGSNGNIGIAGHRDGYFRGLRKVQPRDEILLTSPDGAVARYLVEDARIVAPDNVTVLARRTAPSITLVTCYPFSYIGSAPKRYVLTASKVAEGVKSRDVPAS